MRTSGSRLSFGGISDLRVSLSILVLLMYTRRLIILGTKGGRAVSLLTLITSTKWLDSLKGAPQAMVSTCG